MESVRLVCVNICVWEIGIGFLRACYIDLRNARGGIFCGRGIAQGIFLLGTSAPVVYEIIIWRYGPVQG